MKVVIGKNTLFEGLQLVASVVPQKPTLPVLNNYLLKMSDGQMSISGTDMDIYITTTLECSVEGEGAVTVEAKRFLSIIHELPEEDISISVDNDRITVDSAHGQSKITGLSASDYPALRDSVDGLEVSLSGTDFFEMVDKTSFSVTVDRTRLALTGVLWKVASDNITMVATDGHRLSLFGKNGSLDTDKMVESIVPPKALNQASKVISSGKELEKVIFGDGVILFDFGTTIVFSKLIEGPYPDYMQVIPFNNSKKVYVSTEELSAAVRRVSVLSNSITRQIRLSVSPGTIELTTTNIDIGGEARETVSARYEGEPITVGYNSVFLLEILRKIEADEVVLELESHETACIIKPVGFDESEEQHIYLIMPLRLND